VRQYLQRAKTQETKERHKLPQLLEYLLSPDLSFSSEYRPSRRAGKAAKPPAGEKDQHGGSASGTALASEPVVGSVRAGPEDGWTTIRRIEVNERTLRAVKQNLDLKREAQPDIFQVKAAVPALFIGMDAGRRRPVLTDKNPHVEGLQDIHRCVYLPSAAEKSHQLSSSAGSQNVLFLELPSATLFAPGVGTVGRRISNLVPKNRFVYPADILPVIKTSQNSLRYHCSL
jgi:hypothetical protein